MEAGSQQWPISMRPYDLVAWRFKTSALQVEMTQVEVEGAVRQELERRIEAIELRARNLDIQRSYDQLLNPGFEQAADGGAHQSGRHFGVPAQSVRGHLRRHHRQLGGRSDDRRPG